MFDSVFCGIMEIAIYAPLILAFCLAFTGIDAKSNAATSARKIIKNQGKFNVMNRSLTFLIFVLCQIDPVN